MLIVFSRIYVEDSFISCLFSYPADCEDIPMDMSIQLPKGAFVTVRKSLAWKGAMISAGIVFIMGAAIGSWTDC